jgi:NitT/TauT family transport system ATP-binding protein
MTMLNAEKEVEIKVDHLGVTFQDNEGNDVRALTDVNLDVCKGEFVSLLGPSGCGKTTLLRCVADLQEPTYGEIRVSGKTPREVRMSQKFGFVFQQPVLFDWRTVKKECGTSAGDDVPQTKEAARRTGHGRDAGNGRTYQIFQNIIRDSFPAECSRESISPGHSPFEPDILLMDEPFSALDEFTKDKAARGFA